MPQIGTKRCGVELDLPKDAILRFGIAFRRKTCAEDTASPDVARQKRRRKVKDASEASGRRRGSRSFAKARMRLQPCRCKRPLPSAS